MNKSGLFSNLKMSTARVRVSSSGMWDNLSRKGREFGMGKTFPGMIQADIMMEPRLMGAPTTST